MFHVSAFMLTSHLCLTNLPQVRCLKPGANQALTIARNLPRETDPGAIVFAGPAGHGC